MADTGYATLGDVDEHELEHSSDSFPISSKNPFAESRTPQFPSRAQTFPRLQGAYHPKLEPLRPRPAATPVQTTSYDTSKSETASERRRSSVQSWKQRIKGFVNPSLHDLPDSYLIAPDTSRPYLHVRQRWRLWRLTIGEFGITVVLCLANFLLLYGWSRHRTIDERQKHIFNALSTGLSLLLGLNLAGSLRSYAKLLRWRMLAATYRPLETFDLVLGCASQINVLRLLWRARNSRYRYLPSRTQIFCVVWIVVNLVMAGIVASIGLTYNLDTSNRWVLLQSGKISVLDFTTLLSNNYQYDLSNLHSWGVTGRNWNTTDSFDYEDAGLGYYQSDGSGDSQYFFTDVNPEDPSVLDISWRYVGASVTCTSYSVTDGIYGNKSYIIYDTGSEKINQTFLAPSGPGGLSLATSTNSTCGSRCTDVLVFQAVPLPMDDFTTIITPALFACQSTLSEVTDVTGLAVPPYGRISDELARMLAGSIGWSGVPLPNISSPLQYQSYPESSDTGFLADPDEDDMQGLIADFAIGTLAALDDPKVGDKRILGAGTTPSQAEYLDVKWWKAGGLLITIPCVHFVTLFIVIHWANRAIIKDDSHLAAAKLYHSLFTEKNLADHGCMLRADEIVESMGNPMVAYGWSENEETRHTDVFEEGSGMSTKTLFKEGRYDGVGWPLKRDLKKVVVDARHYF